MTTAFGFSHSWDVIFFPFSLLDSANSQFPLRGVSAGRKAAGEYGETFYACPVELSTEASLSRVICLRDSAKIRDGKWEVTWTFRSQENVYRPRKDLRGEEGMPTKKGAL